MNELPSLQFCYRSDLRFFTVRWLSDSTLLTLQAEYESVLVNEDAHRTERWLLDLRQRPTPTIEANNWVRYNWLPRAAALVPGRLRLAYIISAERAELICIDPELQANLHDALAPNRHYDIHLFGEETEALLWLTA
jgi:hypothetical protein